MARSKGPDLSSTAENPNFETHVDRVQQARSRATPEQEIAGGRWYRAAYHDARTIALGVEPGVHVPHPDPVASAHGYTHRLETGPRTNRAASVLHNLAADADWEQQRHASSLSHEQGMSYAETSRYPGQRVSHANDQGRPYGQFGGSERIRRAAYTIAAMSPAGPTGMDWEHNSQAAYEATHLTPEEQENVRAANRLKVGTPERKEASARAREPFQGRAINHQTTDNVEKALRVHRGEDPAAVLGPDKVMHFGNAIWSEHNPADPLNRAPESIAYDKHMKDVLSGARTGWGKNDRETGYTVRGEREGGDPMLPKESGAGYRYGRDVIHESAGRQGERGKVHQAVVWGVEKAEKESTGAGRNGRGSRAQKK